MSAVRLLHVAAAAFMLVAGTFLLSAFCASIAITSAPSIELGRVTGRVTRNGQPMPNLWVDIGPINGGRPGEGFTNTDGWYELWYTSEKKGAWVGRHRAVIGRGGQIDDQGVPTPSIVMYSRNRRRPRRQRDQLRAAGRPRA